MDIHCAACLEPGVFGDHLTSENVLQRRCGLWVCRRCIRCLYPSRTLPIFLYVLAAVPLVVAFVVAATEPRVGFVLIWYALGGVAPLALTAYCVERIQISAAAPFARVDRMRGLPDWERRSLSPPQPAAEPVGGESQTAPKLVSESVTLGDNGADNQPSITGSIVIAAIVFFVVVVLAIVASSGA